MRRGLWYFLSAQKVQTKDELLENIRQSIIYDRTTEKQAERSQLYPFTCLPFRTLCEESPNIQMSRMRSTWQGMMCTCHWRVLLLRHPRYARPVAAILADNKTTFCRSRTYVRDLIFRDILRFFRASPQQNVSSLCSIEMTDSRFDLAYIELRL